jgi:hypothetical protein
MEVDSSEYNEKGGARSINTISPAVSIQRGRHDPDMSPRALSKKKVVGGGSLVPGRLSVCIVIWVCVNSSHTSHGVRSCLTGFRCTGRFPGRRGAIPGVQAGLAMVAIVGPPGSWGESNQGCGWRRRSWRGTEG